jgi:putative MATE family efflux protein
LRIQASADSPQHLNNMNDQNKNILDDDRVGLVLLKMSLPVFFSMFVTVLYNIVDTVFIGRCVGSLGIAGLSIVFPLQILSMAVGHMTGMGSASLISQSIGNHDNAKAEKAMGNAITVTIALSIVITAVGLINPDFWLRLMGASETILTYARDYMIIIVTGLVLPTLSLAASVFIRAEGNARVSMTGMIIGAVLNIILDVVFIILLDMGIKGAALATVIAQLISVLYFIRFYLFGKSFLKIRSMNLIIEWGIVRSILSIGVASFARTVATSLSVIFVNRMLRINGGDLAISAFGVVNRIMTFALMPAHVIAQGLQPVLGFNYGAKRYDRVLKAIRIAITAATICCIILFVFLYFTPKAFVGIFTTDTALIMLGSYATKRVFFALSLIGFAMVGSLVFQSIGKPIQSFVTAIARPVIFLIPLLLILPGYLQLDGVWLAFPITDVLTCIVTFFLLLPQIREFRKYKKIDH